MHRSKVYGKFQLYHVTYITNENTFQILLHNSGGHFELILLIIKFSTITRCKHSRKDGLSLAIRKVAKSCTIYCV